MRFAFLAAHPVHESVPLFASLLVERGHNVDVLGDGRGFLLERGYPTAFDLAWYRFSPEREPRAEPDEAWETLLAFEVSGIPTLNSSRSLMLGRNKFLSSLCFRIHGLDQPPTELLGPEMPRFAPPYIVKPVFGALSEGVAVFESHTEAVAHGARHGPCIIQRYLAGAETVRVISGREDALLVRRKCLDSDAGYAPPRPPSPEESELCEFARMMILAVDADLMGVDILLADNRLLALEVNGGFGFSPHWRTPGEAIARHFELVASSGYRP